MRKTVCVFLLDLILVTAFKAPVSHIKFKLVQQHKFLADVDPNQIVIILIICRPAPSEGCCASRLTLSSVGEEQASVQTDDYVLRTARAPSKGGDPAKGTALITSFMQQRKPVAMPSKKPPRNLETPAMAEPRWGSVPLVLLSFELLLYTFFSGDFQGVELPWTCLF